MHAVKYMKKPSRLFPLPTSNDTGYLPEGDAVAGNHQPEVPGCLPGVREKPFFAAPANALGQWQAPLVTTGTSIAFSIPGLLEL